MFEKIIEDFVEEAKGYRVRSIILFGSASRGEARMDSDVDLLVIASGLPNIMDRHGFPPIKKPSRIDDIWMTPKELNDMVDAKTGFVVNALLEGKVLLDDGTIKEAQERLKASLERLKARKLKHGWLIPRDNLRKVASFD